MPLSIYLSFFLQHEVTGALTDFAGQQAGPQANLKVCLMELLGTNATL